jgi:hypothetical protein
VTSERLNCYLYIYLLAGYRFPSLPKFSQFAATLVFSNSYYFGGRGPVKSEEDGFYFQNDFVGDKNDFLSNSN